MPPLQVLFSSSKILDTCVQTPYEQSLNALHANIDSRLGSLSKTSKMPGWSWGISARLCKTGAKLRLNPNSPCSKCYALSGHYASGSTTRAHDKRLWAWENEPDWVPLMAARILLKCIREPYFRWFDSGDLQSVKMLQDILDVVRRTPYVNHWLPTQERKLITGVVAPKNLTIRVSSAAIGHVPVDTGGFPTSSVGDIDYESKRYFPCQATLNDHKCGSCRACWDGSTRHVRYAEI